MITEHPRIIGTWWVTDPSRPNIKLCVRRSPFHGSEIFYVWQPGTPGRGKHVSGGLLSALAVAQEMLEAIGEP
jgi:hypothetical protein